MIIYKANIIPTVVTGKTYLKKMKLFRIRVQTFSVSLFVPKIDLKKAAVDNNSNPFSGNHKIPNLSRFNLLSSVFDQNAIINISNDN